MKASNRGIVIFLTAVWLAQGAWLGAQPNTPSLRDSITVEKSFRNGYYFYNFRNYNAAIDFFNQAISVDPYNHRSRIWLGQSYFMAGSLQNAYTEWQVALNLGAGGNLLRSKIQTLYALDARDLRYSAAHPYIFMRSYEGYSDKKPIFTRPSAVAIDDQRNIYVAGFECGKVAILDTGGTIKNVLSYGLSKPFGLAIARDGSLYVSDFGKDTVIKYSRTASKLGAIGQRGFRVGEFSGPEGICLDKSGALYVADTGNNRVQKFNANGDFVLAFGRKGQAEGEFFRPSAVLVLEDGRIVVSDSGNRRLQVFDESGNFLNFLGERQLECPRGLVLLSENEIGIADSRSGVVVYDMRDGSWNRIETLAGRVNNALGLAVDQNRILYVSDFDSYQVSSFIPEQLKYVNLDVRLVRTQESGFPIMQHTVLVRDREGRNITGLTEKNFAANVSGIDIRNVKLASGTENKNRLSLLFVVDKSLDMEEHSERMIQVMRGILERLPARDTIQVINAGERAFISQKYISNVLSPLEGARQGSFTGSPVIGRALYQAVSESFANNYRPVIVLLTAAAFREDDWKPYGFDICLQYARNNGVPVHVVYFGQGRFARQLEFLASETGGRVYDALRSNDIYSLRETVFAAPLPFYELQYEAIVHPKLRNTYHDYQVEVSYNGLFGYDRSGYYIP
jgi:DNA-binding beta-propeller fold protein YncE